MFKVTQETYGKLIEQIERAVENEESWRYDYDDPHSVKGEAEVEVGEFVCTLDFRAYPSYRYEEINPGLYAPYDSQFGYTLTSISVDCEKFTVWDEDGNELEHDFSSKELEKITY